MKCASPVSSIRRVFVSTTIRRHVSSAKNEIYSSAAKHLCLFRRTRPSSLAAHVAPRGTRGGGGGGGAGWARTEVALSLHGPGSGSSTTPLSDALERVVRLQVCIVT